MIKSEIWKDKIHWKSRLLSYFGMMHYLKDHNRYNLGQKNIFIEIAVRGKTDALELLF